MPNAATMPAPSHPWTRRIALGFVLIVLVVAGAGFLYENVSEARDRRFNPPDGKRIDVGGFKMHIDCTGEAAPTVVLDSGLGDTYISWRKVQPEIAKFARVCSYDRAGLGYSEPSPRSRSSRVFAEELHALLQAAGIAPPYVMVGHSMAGFDVRLFTSLYPKEVVGMVLVDVSHPDQDVRFPVEVRTMEGSWQREANFLAYTMPFGVPRLLGFCDDDARQRAAECNFHSAHEAVAEMKAFPESAAQAASTGVLGDMPLAVLSHDPDKPSADFPPNIAKPTNEAWEKMQEELAHLSTRGTQKIVKRSSHYIQLDRPEAVIDAIRDVVGQARKPQSAPPSKP
jgi:pimeloyl-ACP methyl ester carboxylesterase